jgi:hypothetical protein
MTIVIARAEWFYSELQVRLKNKGVPLAPRLYVGQLGSVDFRAHHPNRHGFIGGRSAVDVYVVQTIIPGPVILYGDIVYPPVDSRSLSGSLEHTCRCDIRMRL